MVLMNITLALGGGGIKGFAHIGVLRVLEKEGFCIRLSQVQVQVVWLEPFIQKAVN
jgi:predicted acylesterase/phospholipase RssA